MRNYVIVTDSSCDLPADIAKELELEVVPLKVILNGKEYRNYLDERELPVMDFYEQLSKGAMATTSAINTEEAYAAMESILKKGMDVIYIAFSSGLSLCYESGCAAMKELKPKYPDRKIYCIDTKCASMGQGLIVYLAGRKRLEGATIDEVRDFVIEKLPHVCHWFTVDDLHFLKRGGRVSAATAVLGTMLKIKPVLHVDDDGHLINMIKAKGRKASIKALFNKLVETGTDVSNQEIFISDGACRNETEELAEMIRVRFNPKRIIIGSIGPVIGAHTGPGVIALFFLGSKR